MKIYIFRRILVITTGIFAYLAYQKLFPGQFFAYELVPIVIVIGLILGRLAFINDKE